MRCSPSFVLAVAMAVSADALAPPRPRPEAPRPSLRNAAAAALWTCALWAGPCLISGSNDAHHHHFRAAAVEKASGSGSRVNKDAESLLRYGLPIPAGNANKEVRSLQETIEMIKYDVGSKRKAAALDGAKKAKIMVAPKAAVATKIIKACTDPNECTSLLDQIGGGLDPLQAALKQSQDAFTGSEQEREALDKAYKTQQGMTKLLTKLEEQLVPAGYKTPVPAEYDDLPQLTRRATVEMLIKKGPNAERNVFDVEGVNFPEAKLTMVIDGYAAPVTGGNFIDLVSKGFYDKMAIQRSDGFVVQTGDPDGPAVGYTGGKPSKSVGAGPKGERLIPCEILVKGDRAPFYESTIEDEGRGGEATVLPFSSYGAMGWAREEYDANSGSSQFFWLLFDSDLTPAGKNVLDGRYPCFGYVVEGSDFLVDVKEGDIIEYAKVTDGMQYLVQPKGE